MSRVIVAGCREIPEDVAEQFILKTMSDLHLNNLLTPSSILHGGCRGVDTAADNVFRGIIPVKEFKANWDTHGRAAGPIRNKQMVMEADALVAFWDGKSRGTGGIIELARNAGLQVHVIMVKKQH